MMGTNIFQGVEDMYNGITVDSQKEPCESNQFVNQLNDSLKKWVQENRRCIWFKVNINDAEWIPILAKEGFNFHHSRDNFVMMYKWLPANSSPNLPPACHTNLGVGGIVINGKNQILVVSEKDIKYPHWKLPGGYVEREEDITDAAMREVKEETGIETTFESMVSLRHTHNMTFGNSDIYVIVLLKAKTETICKSDNEIKDCQWMDVEEYLNHPHVHDFNRFIVKQAFDLKTRKLTLAFNKETIKIPKFTRVVTSLVLEDVE